MRTNPTFAHLMSAMGYPLPLTDFEDYCPVPDLVNPDELRRRLGIIPA